MNNFLLEIICSQVGKFAAFPLLFSTFFLAKTKLVFSYFIIGNFLFLI